ncbi:peroxin-4 [Saprolegnia diclina VS20]|uniref:Peroxin-4 n=1 Tax=Saprolegnia diclina (strain VS20) TaxID=1156394 RepID=T0RXY6_SAPDV|nr:peroxin-4 [Saprolegnia diclina VS20]EQC35237.1 peroxin-4 [Saprolegnia diclina VS20]|eukprot:XP_008611521.1 peroxin-4 [Saprolegnia diclina VS20]
MNTNVKRLRKELAELRKHPEADMVLFPLEESIVEWKAFIKGPADTPFEGRVFELAIATTPMYPMEPPKMKFVTKIFHPNVHFQDGSICLDILKREWSPAWTLRAACLAVTSLLSDPAADSPLNCDAGNMIRAGDLMAYNAMAAMYTTEFGLPSLPASPL